MSAIIGHHGLLLNDAGVGQRTRWRIYITDVDGGAAVSINEIEFRATSGGADLCSGGTASASSEFDVDRSVGYAFDNITGVTSNFWGSADGMPQWVRYDLANAAIVNEVTIHARNDGNTFGQSPKNFEIQSSTNGTAWDTEWTVTGSTGWAAGETRTFTRP
jgi:hypothetical protein